MSFLTSARTLASSRAVIFDSIGNGQDQYPLLNFGERANRRAAFGMSLPRLGVGLNFA